MKKHLIPALAAAILAVSATAHAQDAPVVYNNAYYPADVVVQYAFCPQDQFTVPARVKQGAPGRATGASRRNCGMQQINASIRGSRATWVAQPYMAPNTADTQFVIRYISGSTYRVVSRVELGATAFDTALKETNSPEGNFAPTNLATDTQQQITQTQQQLEGTLRIIQDIGPTTVPK